MVWRFKTERLTIVQVPIRFAVMVLDPARSDSATLGGVVDFSTELVKETLEIVLLD